MQSITILYKKLLFKVFILWFKFQRKFFNFFWFKLPIGEELSIQYLINDHLYRQKFIARHTKNSFEGLHPKNVFNFRYEFFKNNVSPKDIVIDLGCGTGLILYHISEIIEKGIGIDNNDRNLKQCISKHNKENLSYIKADILNYDYNKLKQKYPYNTLVISHVLEHLDNPVDLLQKTSADKLLICVPSEENWLTQLKMHFGLPYLSDSTHRKEYSRKQLSHECQQAGYHILFMGFNAEGEIVCRAEKMKKSHERSPVLSYAMMEPKPERISHGGSVKLSILSNYYPTNDIRFNILYLVSSKLPKNLKQIIQNCKKLGIRIVLNQNGVAYPAWAGNKFMEMNTLLIFAYENADYIFYQSEFSKKSATKYLGKPHCKNEVLYNSVDVFQFKESGNSSKKTANLLVIGSHHQKERVFLAIDALEKMLELDESYCLKIAGKYLWNENAEKELISYIRDKNIEKYISIERAYTQEEAIKIYQQAHILLHLKYKDPCPTVPIEAMACGLPVIASNSGGMPELVKDAGILIDVPDDWGKLHYPELPELISAIKSINKDYDNYSRKARENVVHHFSKEKWIAQHQEIFNKVLNEE